jgi:hypothetical protein
VIDEEETGWNWSIPYNPRGGGAGRAGGLPERARNVWESDAAHEIPRPCAGRNGEVFEVEGEASRPAASATSWSIWTGILFTEHTSKL